MKKKILLILFIATVLVQISFPLKTIFDQHMARTYGEETLKEIELKRYSFIKNILFYEYNNNRCRIHLKKEAIEKINICYGHLDELDAKLKIKTLGNKEAIIDIVVEGIALKNVSADDLKLLDEKLTKIKLSYNQKKSD